MPFTALELENISNTTLDFHLKGKVHAQTLQSRPLTRIMKAKQRMFPGGKEFITERIKGTYTTGIQGFSHDEEVGYANPANIKQTSWKWYEIHAGISFTFTEMKKGGISVVESTTGSRTAEHSQAELIQLANLLEDKLDDMSEGFARGFHTMLWRDGTQDAKLVPGIRSILVNVPSTATTVGGVDQAANDFWRNRVSLAIDVSTPSNLNLTNKLQDEARQLRRFGGRPNRFLCGSEFLEGMEKELRSKGTFTQVGWSKTGVLDASMADIAFKGVSMEYDPTLDDESLEKYGFWFDDRHIHLRVMENEDMKQHNPARPENRYVVYRAVTWTGGLTAMQRNSSGVYSIA